METFTERMEKEIKANAHKGDWRPFAIKENRHEILREIEHHYNKLVTAYESGDEELIREHSADIGNIAMFMYESANSKENKTMETPKEKAANFVLGKIDKAIENSRLEEIRDIVAKNRGYDSWEILNGSDLYDSDIDEVAKKYAESKTAQLQADKKELLEALQDIQDELENGDTPHVYKIESLIQKHKQ